LQGAARRPARHSGAPARPRRPSSPVKSGRRCLPTEQEPARGSIDRAWSRAAGSPTRMPGQDRWLSREMEPGPRNRERRKPRERRGRALSWRHSFLADGPGRRGGHFRHEAVLYCKRRERSRRNRGEDRGPVGSPSWEIPTSQVRQPRPFAGAKRRNCGRLRG
jgi:hypothetical protein